MARRDTQLAHLASVDLFSGCTKKELQLIARASDEIHIPAGETFMTQGSVGRECFVIISGSATVHRNGQHVATIGPGSCVGELALLDKGPRTATVVAESDLDALVLSQHGFADVLQGAPHVGHKLAIVLARRLRELDNERFG